VPREINSRYLQKASNRTLFLIQRAAVNVTGIDGNRRKLSNKVKTPLYIAARGSFTAIVDMIIKTARLDYPIPVGICTS